VSSVPYTRTLPYVLRDQLRPGDAQVRILVGTFVSAPDNAHAVVSIGGTNITVPRLASYTAPVVGQPVYLLTAGLITIALGTVKT